MGRKRAPDLSEEMPRAPSAALALLVVALVAGAALAGPANNRPPPPSSGGGGGAKGAIDAARTESPPPKRAGGSADACPIYVDGTRTLVPCPSSGSYECRGKEGCVAAGTKDARRVDRRTNANGDVIGNCTIRGNNTRTVQCALACAGKRCPAGSGWIYGCSAGRCAKVERAASARAGSVGCDGDLRKDVCGVCGGKGKDLCGNCPAAGVPCNATLPDGTVYIDAVVPAGDDAYAVVDTLSDLTGVNPNLFVVTSRAAAPARRSRGLSQTSTDTVVVAIAAAGANETAEILAEASLTGASPYEVRSLADVAAADGSAASPTPTPSSPPATGGGGGGGDTPSGALPATASNLVRTIALAAATAALVLA